MTDLRHLEIQELLGAYAVDAIDDPAEHAGVEAHIRECDTCRAEVDGHLGVLALFAAEARVDDAAWASLAAVLAEPEAAPAPSPAQEQGATIIPFRSRRRIAAWIAPVAAAAAAVLITIAVGRGDDLGAPAVNAAVKPLLPAASVAGTVSLYRTSAPDGVVVIDLKNVPAAPAGHHYEVWVLRPGDKEMEAIGAFSPAGGTVRLKLRLPGAGEYVAVDISVEEDGGSAEHSGTSLARATLA